MSREFVTAFDQVRLSLFIIYCICLLKNELTSIKICQIVMTPPHSKKFLTGRQISLLSVLKTLVVVLIVFWFKGTLMQI